MKGMEAPEVEPLLDERIAVTVPPAMATITPPQRSSGGSCEVEDRGEDPESPLAPCCRFCLEGGGNHGDDLISPCLCKGTQQFVHRGCLDRWRSEKEGFAFSHCTTCKAQFHLRIAMPEVCSWRKMKFRFFVARDVIFVFLMMNMVIAVLGYLAYLMDRNGVCPTSLDIAWELFPFSKSPIPYYYCVGVFGLTVLIAIFGVVSSCFYWGGANCLPCDIYHAGAFMLAIVAIVFVFIGIVYCPFLATLAVQHIWQKCYLVRAKRYLTKEYIVEDLHGCYTPPELDPEHQERLKYLELL